jgi:hypothetical protein
VVTKTGDILDRENPSVPSGVTPPSPDRPLYPTWQASTAQILGSRVIPTVRNGYAYEITDDGTSTATVPTWSSALTQGSSVTQNGVTYTNVGSEYREFTHEGAEASQLWIFERPGGQIGEEWGPYNEEVIEVVPGQTYTHAVLSRHSVLESNPEYDAALPLDVTLEGEDLDPLPMGSPFGAGATGISAWSSTDKFHTIAVPATDVDGNSYTQARIRCLNKHGAVFVLQEHLWALGSLTTQAARDAARKQARQTTGSFTAILNSQCPEVRQSGMALGNKWKSFGVDDTVDALPAGNTITGVTFRSSDTESFSGSFITDPNLVIPRNFLEIKGTVNGDGVDSPRIPAGGVYLSTEKVEPTLLRADYSEFSGGTFLTGLEIPPLRREYAIVEEGGEVFAPAISDEKQYLKPFVIHVHSQETLEEIEETPPKGILGIESAMLSGTGLRLLIRPNQVIDFVSQPVTARVLDDDNGEPKRFVYATASIERAEIVSRGRMW